MRDDCCASVLVYHGTVMLQTDDTLITVWTVLSSRGDAVRSISNPVRLLSFGCGVFIYRFPDDISRDMELGESGNCLGTEAGGARNDEAHFTITSHHKRVNEAIEHTYDFIQCMQKRLRTS